MFVYEWNVKISFISFKVLLEVKYINGCFISVSTEPQFTSHLRTNPMRTMYYCLETNPVLFGMRLCAIAIAIRLLSMH